MSTYVQSQESNFECAVDRALREALERQEAMHKRILEAHRRMAAPRPGPEAPASSHLDARP